ncbi:MAG: hypothetical protein GY861_13405 [bacterium]|nr:hypothetical protein [bacterium]
MFTHVVYEGRKRLVVFDVSDTNCWLTWDVLYSLLKSEDPGSLLKGREFKDKPRNCAKLYERTKSEERKRTSGWTQKVQKSSHIICPGEKSSGIHKTGERSPDFHKFTSGNDFSDTQKFKSSFEDSRSAEFLNSDTNLSEFEPKLNQGQYLANLPSKSPGAVSCIQCQTEQSENGRTLRTEQKMSEDQEKRIRIEETPKETFM